jgi:hypothetical protein
MWCWWCCHSFESEPLGFPYKYDDLKDQFFTTGHFCSFDCVKAYNLDRDSATKAINAMWILLMKKRLTGSLAPIRTAPKRHTLKQFGGPLTIEDFRSGSLEVTSRLPNEIRQPPEITIKKVSQAPEELVLKRPKPLKREQSLLEKSLGLRSKCQSGSSLVAQK